jgi:2-methylisocitrate lyase-like PEP mutase family enzyme
MEQAEKAELLRRLHHGPEILVLPNVWDAASARVVQAQGFPAIATSSSGCAAVLGFLDGEIVPRERMIRLLTRIVEATDLPVTADLEAGYGDPVGTALAAIEAGAVGMNFEDFVDGQLVPLDEQCACIRAIRGAVGSAFVLNCRTDVYLRKIAGEDGVARLNAYRDAGADCLFAPGVVDAEAIESLVRAVKGPLNILAQPGSPSITEMHALGVARVSFGSGPSRIALGALRRFAKELHEYGTFPALANEAIPFDEVQELLRRR